MPYTRSGRKCKLRLILIYIRVQMVTMLPVRAVLSKRSSSHFQALPSSKSGGTVEKKREKRRGSCCNGEDVLLDSFPLASPPLPSRPSKVNTLPLPPVSKASLLPPACSRDHAVLAANYRLLQGERGGARVDSARTRAPAPEQKQAGIVSGNPNDYFAPSFSLSLLRLLAITLILIPHNPFDAAIHFAR